MITFPDPDIVYLARHLPGAVDQNVKDLIGRLAADRAAWRRRGHEYQTAWRSAVGLADTAGPRDHELAQP